MASLPPIITFNKTTLKGYNLSQSDDGLSSRNYYNINLNHLTSRLNANISAIDVASITTAVATLKNPLRILYNLYYIQA